MGGLVSRRKRTKVEARSVSTQATECKNESQAATCQVEAATDARETEKATVTELNIGDGILSRSQLPQHEVVVERRASTENKKRRGLSKVKIRPKSGKKIHAQGVDFSTQYDFLNIPGQVSPSFRSPITVNSVQKNVSSEAAIRPPLEQPYESIDFDLPPPRSDQREEGAKPLQEKANERQAILGTRKETVVDNNVGEEDENSNIVKEGTLLAELRNRELYGGCTDDELSTVHGDGNEPQVYSTGRSSAERSPRRARKKTVTYNEDCKTTMTPASPGKILSGANKDFKQSLEEIFQSNLPCHAEVMEVAAVTGTARHPMPAHGGYEDMRPARYQTRWESWESGVRVSGADSQRGAEKEAVKKEARGAEGGAGESSQQGQEASHHDEEDADVDNDGCRGHDIAEDTLDWNVDDRVRSPTDSRSDSINSSDNDDNVDLLTDCTIDVVATSAGQRQSSLTTLKDGDSAGGSIYSPPSQSPCASARQSADRGSAKLRPGSDKGQVKERLGKDSESNALDAADGQPTSATRPGADVAADAGSTQSPPKDGSRATTPTTQSGVALSKPDKILMSFDDKTLSLGGGRKSLLAMQEAEAMTLLLLTGTLPGDDGGAVTRGAGDAQNLDASNGTNRADEHREADERAGLASMLDTQSKSSCQLEQLQAQTESSQNMALQAPQSGQTSDDSSAAGTETTQRPQPPAPHHSPDTEQAADSSCPDGTCGTRRASTDATAAACLAGEDGDDKPPSPKPVSSPGAASPEEDWEVIPLHRVPGQTDLGGSAAGASATEPQPPDRSPPQPAAPADSQPPQGRAAAESDIPGEGPAVGRSGSLRDDPAGQAPLQQQAAMEQPDSGDAGEPSPRHSSSVGDGGEKETADSKLAEVETAASSEAPIQRAGAGNSPKQARASVVTLTINVGEQTTTEGEADENQNANTPSALTARSGPSPKRDGKERSGSSSSQRKMERKASKNSRRQTSATKIITSSPTSSHP